MKSHTRHCATSWRAAGVAGTRRAGLYAAPTINKHCADSTPYTSET